MKTINLAAVAIVKKKSRFLVIEINRYQEMRFYSGINSVLCSLALYC